MRAAQLPDEGAHLAKISIEPLAAKGFLRSGLLVWNQVQEPTVECSKCRETVPKIAREANKASTRRCTCHQPGAEGLVAAAAAVVELIQRFRSPPRGWWEHSRELHLGSPLRRWFPKRRLFRVRRSSRNASVCVRAESSVEVSGANFCRRDGRQSACGSSTFRRLDLCMGMMSDFVSDKRRETCARVIGHIASAASLR